MIPPFDADGNLPPGIHWVDWPEFFTRFGTTAHRLRLLAGLKSALDALRQAGCAAVYVDGSFVTTKVNPADYDACWDPRGVSPYLIDPVFLTFDAGRAMQKSIFGGEFFPAGWPEGRTGQTFLEFFQTNRSTGERKGIVAFDLRSLP